MKHEPKYFNKVLLVLIFITSVHSSNAQTNKAQYAINAGLSALMGFKYAKTQAVSGGVSLTKKITKNKVTKKWLGFNYTSSIKQPVFGEQKDFFYYSYFVTTPQLIDVYYGKLISINSTINVGVAAALGLYNGGFTTLTTATGPDAALDNLKFESHKNIGLGLNLIASKKIGKRGSFYFQNMPMRNLKTKYNHSIINITTYPPRFFYKMALGYPEFN